METKPRTDNEKLPNTKNIQPRIERIERIQKETYKNVFIQRNAVKTVGTGRLERQRGELMQPRVQTLG